MAPSNFAASEYPLIVTYIEICHAEFSYLSFTSKICKKNLWRGPSLLATEKMKTKKMATHDCL